MTELTESSALGLMRRGDEAGLRWYIRRYTRYVTTIVWNIIGHGLTVQDAEEVTADVFMTLWQYAQNPQAEKVKSYLGAIARSRAVDRLRKTGVPLDLEYDELELTTDSTERQVLVREGKRQLRQALEAMNPTDREIFIRHYYYGETASAIGNRLGMTSGAVRQRLKRGRDFLRQTLVKGGGDIEALYI